MELLNIVFDALTGHSSLLNNLIAAAIVVPAFGWIIFALCWEEEGTPPKFKSWVTLASCYCLLTGIPSIAVGSKIMWLKFVEIEEVRNMGRGVYGSYLFMGGLVVWLGASNLSKRLFTRRPR